MFPSQSYCVSLLKGKEGREGGREEGRKERRKKGRKEGRKEGRKGIRVLKKTEPIGYILLVFNYEDDKIYYKEMVHAIMETKSHELPSAS